MTPSGVCLSPASSSGILSAKGLRAMPGNEVVEDKLDSWKEIADYLGRNVRTAIRWEKDRGLPVHRIPGGQRHAVYAYRHEIDAWLKLGAGGKDGTPVVLEDRRPSIETFPSPLAPRISGVLTTEITDELALAPAAQAPGRRRPSVVHNRTVLWFIACAMIGVGIAAYAYHSLAVQSRMQITAVLQLTSDGRIKEGLVVGDEDVFFGEYRDGQTVLAYVPRTGGPIRTIPTPFSAAIPESISPDGSKLLVLDRSGEEHEHALWIVPIFAGTPYRVGHVLCHSAVWSPDGKEIAFAFGHGIYVTSDKGKNVTLLEEFVTIPDLLHFTRDGSAIRFELRDLSAWSSSIWEIALLDKDSEVISSLVPLQVKLSECCNSLSRPDRSGSFFLQGWTPSLGSVLLFAQKTGFWHKRFSIRQVGGAPSQLSAIALYPQAQGELFAICASALPQRLALPSFSELLWFDPVSREFRPFLPGISAHDVDFSRDQRWIAWVRIPENTLWISHPDGSDARRISLPPGQVELPRWSPNGKWIAFMADTPGNPWRIFVAPVTGGSPKEVAAGADNQGAPTWSPDSKWLVYGNVWCQETDSCMIRKINLLTGQQFAIPGSDGMGTARWSPDGRYLAALKPTQQELYLFDFRAQQWRKLGDGINGDDLSWSADSRFIFASVPNGATPKIVRVSLEGRMDTAVDLSSFSKLKGRMDTWFAVGPGGSFVLSHWVQPSEIYALRYH